MMKATNWLKEFELRNALWIRPNKEFYPHAQVSKGLHSDGFFNYYPIISDSQLMEKLVYDTLELFAQKGGDSSMVNNVIGVLRTDAKFSESLSHQLPSTRAVSLVVRKTKNKKKTILLSDDEASFMKMGYSVLCTNVIATGGTVRAISEELREEGVSLLPFVFTLMNRSGLTEIDGLEIISVVGYPLETWVYDDEIKDCPLCESHSKAISGKKEWKKLLQDANKSYLKNLEKK